MSRFSEIGRTCNHAHRASGKGLFFFVVDAVNQSKRRMNVVKSSQKHGRRDPETSSSREVVSKRRPASGDPADSRRWRGAITVFILFHLIAITCWALPWNLPVFRDVKVLVLPYLRWSGLFQSWDMFAPNPEPVNSYIKAVVITQNHHVRVWEFPRMEELSLWERYRKERYRKFAEGLPNKGDQALWPDVASHIARAFDRPGDPPDQVMLIQYRSDIKLGTGESDEAAPKLNVFYEAYVEPGDLR